MHIVLILTDISNNHENVSNSLPLPVSFPTNEALLVGYTAVVQSQKWFQLLTFELLLPVLD